MNAAIKQASRTRLLLLHVQRRSAPLHVPRQRQFWSQVTSYLSEGSQNGKQADQEKSPENVARAHSSRFSVGDRLLKNAAVSSSSSSNERKMDYRDRSPDRKSFSSMSPEKESNSSLPANDEDFQKVSAPMRQIMNLSVTPIGSVDWTEAKKCFSNFDRYYQLCALEKFRQKDSLRGSNAPTISAHHIQELNFAVRFLDRLTMEPPATLQLNWDDYLLEITLRLWVDTLMIRSQPMRSVKTRDLNRTFHSHKPFTESKLHLELQNYHRLANQMARLPENLQPKAMWERLVEYQTNRGIKMKTAHALKVIKCTEFIYHGKNLSMHGPLLAEKILEYTIENSIANPLLRPYAAHYESTINSWLALREPHFRTNAVNRVMDLLQKCKEMYESYQEPDMMPTQNMYFNVIKALASARNGPGAEQLLEDFCELSASAGHSAKDITVDSKYMMNEVFSAWYSSEMDEDIKDGAERMVAILEQLIEQEASGDVASFRVNHHMMITTIKQLKWLCLSDQGTPEDAEIAEALFDRYKDLIKDDPRRRIYDSVYDHIASCWSSFDPGRAEIFLEQFARGQETNPCSKQFLIRALYRGWRDYRRPESEYDENRPRAVQVNEDRATGANRSEILFRRAVSGELGSYIPQSDDVAVVVEAHASLGHYENLIRAERLMELIEDNTKIIPRSDENNPYMNIALGWIGLGRVQRADIIFRKYTKRVSGAKIAPEPASYLVTLHKILSAWCRSNRTLPFGTVRAEELLLSLRNTALFPSAFAFEAVIGSQRPHVISPNHDKIVAYLDELQRDAKTKSSGNRFREIRNRLEEKGRKFGSSAAVIQQNSNKKEYMEM